MRLVVVAMLMLVLCLGGPVAADEWGSPVTGAAKADFLATWGTRLQSMRTLHMAFQQAKHLRMLRQPLQAQGELWLKDGTLLYVLTNTAGDKELVVRLDKQTVRAYYPLLHTLEVIDLQTTGVSPLALPVWQTDPAAMVRDYEVDLFERSGRYMLRLVPKEGKVPLQELRLVIQDFQPQELIQIDKNGTRLHMQITSFTLNPTLSEAQVELHVPAGTTVTQPLR
jgi:outer membrane lipoprotein-sorting protein